MTCPRSSFRFNKQCAPSLLPLSSVPYTYTYSNPSLPLSMHTHPFIHLQFLQLKPPFSSSSHSSTKSPSRISFSFNDGSLRYYAMHLPRPFLGPFYLNLVTPFEVLIQKLCFYVLAHFFSSPLLLGQLLFLVLLLSVPGTILWFI